MRMYLVSAREGAGAGVLPAGGIGFEPSAQFEMMSAREAVEQLVEFRAVVFVDRMAEFVDNHVVDQLVGQLHQVDAQ